MTRPQNLSLFGETPCEFFERQKEIWTIKDGKWVLESNKPSIICKIHHKPDCKNKNANKWLK